MWCEDERQKTEKYKIVIEKRLNENEQGSVFSFKGCGVDRQRLIGWNVRITNYFDCFSLFIFDWRRDTEMEGGKGEMIYVFS